ncbi:Uncharacterised protein [Cedecea neteri]|uniref:Uncharacterized protein n=1 Tax=Cedecea neteri TaxID=158822 RepID=A0A2X2SYW0_9ENTR|nr:Uncharacterised protein [Cedecea neteri]
MPVDFAAGAFQHDNVLDGFHIWIFKRVIHVLFQRDGTPGAHAFVGGDHQPGAGVDDASGHGFRREAAKDNGMHGANARAGEHSNGSFRHHWHINRNNIAFLNAQFDQGVGKTADIAMQLAISDVFALGRVIALPDNGGLIAPFFQVPVEAVRG